MKLRRALLAGEASNMKEGRASSSEASLGL